MLTCVLFLRPDREEASVMPLINAGFNRVRHCVWMCVSSAACICIILLICFYIPSVNTQYKAGIQIVNHFCLLKRLSMHWVPHTQIIATQCISRTITYAIIILIWKWDFCCLWLIHVAWYCPLTFRDMWRMPIWWPAIMSCYSWSMERCGRSSNWGESCSIVAL